MNDETLLRALWPEFKPTPLLQLPALAGTTNVGRVLAKNEAERPLGNFKVLGGMTAGVRALARAANVSIDALLSKTVDAALPRLITASDGNHGLAVAAAAARCGTRASIYLPATVSLTRVRRIESHGARIIHIDGSYDEAVQAAADAAARGEGLLVPDTSEHKNDALVMDVMRGYHVLAREIIAQLEPLQIGPTHVFVQAGVGGLPAAIADALAPHMREPKKIVIVEPAAAACVTAALEAGHPVQLEGDLHTAAEMLACGLASASAVEILKRHETACVVVDEPSLHAAPETLRQAGGPGTTPSGATGLAGLLQVAADPSWREAHQLTPESTVLLIVTEGALV
jgi:diaminopropionate ammonia-lyase